MRIEMTTSRVAKMKVCADLHADADKGDARPGDTVEEFGGGDLGAPDFQFGVFARLVDELPADADKDAFGDEDRPEPEEELIRRRPEHGAYGDDHS